MNFRAIIVDKDRYIANLCDNDYDVFYYKMYYQLLVHKLDAFSHYNIYIDIKDNLGAYRVHKLEDIANIKYGVIKKIQLIRSEEAFALQLCDLIIGAISYKLNHADKRSIPKLKLIDKIEKRLGFNITQHTQISESKFNVFRINI